LRDDRIDFIPVSAYNNNSVVSIQELLGEPNHVCKRVASAGIIRILGIDIDRKNGKFRKGYQTLCR